LPQIVDRAACAHNTFTGLGFRLAARIAALNR